MTTITIHGLGAAIAGIERLGALETQQLVSDLADMQATNITKRVQAGMGLDDGPIPPIKDGRSTPLWRDGGMVGSIGVVERAPTSAKVGFTTPGAGQKATWHQFGTGTWGPSGQPYPIRPKNRKALAFESGGGHGSFSNAVRVGSRDSRQDQQFYGVGKAPKTTRKITGMTVVAGVTHPGVQPRPFFGISPADREKLQGLARDRWEQHIKQAGPQG